VCVADKGLSAPPPGVVVGCGGSRRATRGRG